MSIRFCSRNGQYFQSSRVPRTWFLRRSISRNRSIALGRFAISPILAGSVGHRPSHAATQSARAGALQDARFVGHRFTRQRLGARQTPTAFPRIRNNFSNFTSHSRKGLRGSPQWEAIAEKSDDDQFSIWEASTKYMQSPLKIDLRLKVTSFARDRTSYYLGPERRLEILQVRSW
jgi:hypothetical protein